MIRGFKREERPENIDKGMQPFLKQWSESTVEELECRWIY
jgi:hypothetical protein